jgi:hypothetical protein
VRVRFLRCQRVLHAGLLDMSHACAPPTPLGRARILCVRWITPPLACTSVAGFRFRCRLPVSAADFRAHCYSTADFRLSIAEFRADRVERTGAVELSATIAPSKVCCARPSPHHDSPELFYVLRRHPNLRCIATPNQRCTPPPNRNPNLRAPPSDLSRHLTCAPPPQPHPNLCTATLIVREPD